MGSGALGGATRAYPPRSFLGSLDDLLCDCQSIGQDKRRKLLSQERRGICAANPSGHFFDFLGLNGRSALIHLLESCFARPKAVYDSSKIIEAPVGLESTPLRGLNVSRLQDRCKNSLCVGQHNRVSFIETVGAVAGCDQDPVRSPIRVRG